jgi:hypothetical protein
VDRLVQISLPLRCAGELTSPVKAFRDRPGRTPAWYQVSRCWLPGRYALGVEAR